MVNGTPLTVQATGQCGIPAGASAIAFDPVAVNPSDDGFFQFYPGSTPGVTSAINFKAGKNRANNAIVELDAAGAVTARAIVAGGGSVDLVLDVFGFFFVPPTAVDDAYSTPKNTPLNVPAPGVLSNDTGNQNQAVPFSGPTAHGTVALLADGSFTYTPAAGYFGADSFPYTVQNLAGSANGTVTVSVQEPASITSANATTFTVGANGTFTVTATGYPVPSITVMTGTLPPNVTLTDNGNGTATLAGIPQVGTGGLHAIVLAASNGVGPDGTQNFTLTVNEGPTITSANQATFPIGQAGTFTVTTTGYPPPVITKTGALPANVTLTDNGNGTATIAGTPAPGTAGDWPITIDANGISDATQNFTLHVTCAAVTVTPATLPGGTTGVAYSQGVAGSGGTGPYTFAVTAGTLPSGVNLNGSSGALTGTPTVAATFNFTITATDANGCTGFTAYSVTIVCPVIAVNPATLPGGTVGTPYSQSVIASGGSSPYTYAVASGGLPTNLTLDNATGLISGTPTAPGTYTFTITATDLYGCTGTSATYGVQICPAITVGPASLPDATINVPYPTQTITPSGGTGPYTFTVSAGTLPSGLALDSNTGDITGTADTLGSSTFTIRATQGDECFGERQYTVRTCVAQNLTPSPGALAPATLGSPYGSSVVASGGAGPYGYAVTAGALPPPLAINPGTGAITGTPNTLGNFSFTVTATDGATGCSIAGGYSIRVCATITLTVPPLPGGTVGTPYNQSVVASGGAGPYTYAVTSGSLPTNLNLDANTGAITGTPTAANTFGFTITATDANGCTGSQAYSIKICPVITVNPPASVCATVGGSFNQTITATGGTGPYTFAVTSGSLPPTLNLSSGGALAGTTTTAGNYGFTVTATDANGCTGSAAITIPVLGALTPAGPALPDTTYGSAYSQSITGSGGSGLTYSVTAGALPSWLSLNSGTGALTGTASGADGAGNYSFTITATDPGSGCSVSRPYTFTSRPVVVADSLAFGVGNTEYYSGGFSPTPSTPFVSTATNILGNDLAPAGFTTATIVTQPSNGTVTLNSNGSFRFTPSAGANSSVSFTYKITVNGVDSASTATVTIPLTTRVWYVNAAVANGNGTSNSPFNAVHNAQAPSAAGEYIFIHSGGTFPAGDGIALQPNQVLWGQGATLDVGNLTIPATSKPTLTGTVTLNSGVTVSSLDIVTNPGSQAGIDDPAGAISGVTIKNGVSVATTTGTAVLLSDVDSTAGGSPNFGINFVSVSANGGTNGISLTNVNTASGSFTVTGNSGGLCGGLVTVFSPGTPNGVTAPNTADCTGGTIQGTTGAGVLLANAANVSLTRMFIHDSGSDEINATALNGLTIDRCYVTDASGAAGDRGIEIGDFATGTAVNGVINITNSTIGPTPHDNVGVGIGSGTSTWNVTGTVFDASQLNSGFNFEIRNATVSSFTMNSCVLRNQLADGLQMQPAAGVNATITSATIQNTTFQGNNIGLDLDHDGTSSVTYKVLQNTFINQVAASASLFSSAAAGTSGTLNGRFVGNVIGSAGIFNSGGGVGLRVNVNGGADATVLVDGNTIRQVPNGRGIEIISRNGTGGTDATVTNNFVNTDFTPTVQNGGFSLSNIFLQSDCVSVCNTLRADVRGNTVPAVAPTGELANFQLVIIQSGASTNQLVDNPPASPNAAAELASHNTGNTGVSGTVTLIPGPINTPP